jgi:hypothetical protein
MPAHAIGHQVNTLVVIDEYAVLVGFSFAADVGNPS